MISTNGRIRDIHRSLVEVIEATSVGWAASNVIRAYRTPHDVDHSTAVDDSPAAGISIQKIGAHGAATKDQAPAIENATSFASCLVIGDHDVAENESGSVAKATTVVRSCPVDHLTLATGRVCIAMPDSHSGYGNARVSSYRHYTVGRHARRQSRLDDGVAGAGLFYRGPKGAFTRTIIADAVA